MRFPRPIALIFAGILANGCSLTNDGAAPDRQEVNFPISILAQGDDLVVINSNFDLKFNGAAVQRMSRAAVEAALTADQDGIVPMAELLPGSRQTVIVDSHSARSAFSLDGRFLYIPVRSQPSLTAIELEASGGLGCDQDAGGRCADSARVGVTPSDNVRQVTFPSDPVAVVVGDQGNIGGVAGDEFVVVGHGGGRASLFFRPSATDAAVRPALVDVLSDLPANITGVALEPASQLVWMTSSATGDASDGQIARVGVALDGSSPSDSFLFPLESRRVEGPSGNRDTRDILFGRRAGADVAFVLARTPESLWFVDLGASPTRFVTDAVLPIGVGPTQLVSAELTVGGVPRAVLLATCYNAREIYVIDPALGVTLSVIRGSASRSDQDRDSSRLSGPYAMAFSPASTLPARLYVADFRASTIRVIDFSPLEECLEQNVADTRVSSCEPTVVGTLGEPSPVGDLL